MSSVNSNWIFHYLAVTLRDSFSIEEEKAIWIGQIRSRGKNPLHTHSQMKWMLAVADHMVAETDRHACWINWIWNSTWTWREFFRQWVSPLPQLQRIMSAMETPNLTLRFPSSLPPPPLFLPSFLSFSSPLPPPSPFYLHLCVCKVKSPWTTNWA